MICAYYLSLRAEDTVGAQSQHSASKWVQNSYSIHQLCSSKDCNSSELTSAPAAAKITACRTETGGVCTAEAVA